MNLYLVEDESWALSELKALCRIYEPEHRVFGFECGEDALDACASNPPDVIVTDINMPGMDGLELLRMVRTRMPSVKGIVLSVHDDFEYAQQGMQMGLNDYLLKPAKKEALYHTIDRALLQGAQEKRERQQQRDWCFSQLLLKPMEEREEQLGLLSNKAWLLVFFMIGNGGQRQAWNPDKHHILQREAVIARFKTTEIYVADLDSQRKMIMIPVGSKKERQAHIDRLQNLGGEMDQMGIVVQIGYAEVDPTQALSETSRSLQAHVERQMRLGETSFITPQIKRCDKDLSSLWEQVRLLKKYMADRDIVKGQATLQGLLQALHREQITSRQLSQFLQDLVYSLKFSLDSPFSWDEAGMMLLDQLSEELLNTDYDRLYTWLKVRLWETFATTVDCELKPKNLAPVLINWIHNQYHEDISITQFASSHHFSVGYLSRLFKEQTGQTFSDYLIRFRMDKAKGLLDAGVDKLQDVARMVGYEDPKHFSQVFRKTVGVPPKAYVQSSNVKK